MPDVATPFLDRDVADLRALAEEDLGRAAAVAGLGVIFRDVFVEIVEARVLAGNDQGVGKDAVPAFVREVLPEHRLVELHPVGHVQKRAAGEERGMERRETIAVSVHKGEQPRFDQLRMVFRRLAEWLENHTGRQARRALQLQAIEVLERRELARVETADVRAAPFLIGLAWRWQPLVRVERSAPPLLQPVGLPLEHPQRFRVESHGYPTEPSISSWMSRFSSTAYSSGSSLVNGSMKPLPIMVSASERAMPRLSK